MNSELSYWELLKDSVAQKFCENNTPSSLNISEWKGQDITSFQEDLFEKVKGQLSEKWFYTHMKSKSEKPPRIDMLNLLSEYAGFENWAAFKKENGAFNEKLEMRLGSRKNDKTIVLGIVSFFIIGFILIMILKKETHLFRFCFIDSDRWQAISSPIDVLLMREEQSPLELQSDSSGCIYLESTNEMIQFVVKSPYYKTDTITRVIGDHKSNEGIKLRSNDYAMMIHIFSKSKVDDWKKRRSQLDGMIDDKARIFQIDPKSMTGMELLNKWDFINKMTMPLKSLKNIEVIETVYTGDKILMLRFKQN